LNDLQVELDIAQNDFSRLKARQKGIVTVDAFPISSGRATIAEMSPEANRQKATVQVKVQIDKPDEHLRPDMNATVKFLADDDRSASQEPSGAVVPSSAVRDRDGQKSGVYHPRQQGGDEASSHSGAEKQRIPG